MAASKKAHNAAACTVKVAISKNAAAMRGSSFPRCRKHDAWMGAFASASVRAAQRAGPRIGMVMTPGPESAPISALAGETPKKFEARIKAKIGTSGPLPNRFRFKKYTK